MLDPTLKSAIRWSHRGQPSGVNLEHRLNCSRSQLFWQPLEVNTCLMGETKKLLSVRKLPLSAPSFLTLVTPITPLPLPAVAISSKQNQEKKECWGENIVQAPAAENCKQL